jgi:UDPglucose 6-dehydrogenase
MKVGFLGTGKLGLPVSLVYANRGHEVFCYDVNSQFYDRTKSPLDFLVDEERDTELKGSLRASLEGKSLPHTWTTLQEIADVCDLVFVAVQTPHDARYEGTRRLPEERIDFDYSYLGASLEALSSVCRRTLPVIIISTVLPGTIRREILPIISPHIRLCYNPYFIAMGTVAYDCLNPEFILLGNHDLETSRLVTEFYKTICEAPVFSTTIENAELIKVTYNTIITTKTVIGNTLLELCSTLPNTDCDVVVDALSLATRRIISPSYYRGGMGDGGGCHPRDNIALSWLSRKCGLRYDLYESIMLARERQCEFLADTIESAAKAHGLPICLLGKSFKPNTGISTGSSAVLLETILQERGVSYTIHDPHVTSTEALPTTPHVFFISCAHDAFNAYTLPPNSVVIDPHRKFKPIATGVYVPLGRSM